jgi:ADP-heptose:LPS heptosyltransferase
LAINVEQSSSSGRLSVKLSKSKYKFLGDLDLDSTFNFPAENARHIAIFPVLNFRNYLQESDIDLLSNQIFPLDLKLSNDELNQGKLKLNEIISRNNQPTIALFTFATGDKCYNKEWWQFFLNELKHHFENDYNLIEILPVENVSQLDFSLPTFYSKDIRQIASLIASTKIFIGADSGLMHLASASKTTTIGLFSVTDSEKYAPFGNNSFAIRTNEMAWSEMISSIKKVLV